MLSIFFLLLAFGLYAIPAWSQDVARPNNGSLLWGPYRPNLYFGVRPRTPDSLLMGLMWSNADQTSYKGISKSESFSKTANQPQPLIIASSNLFLKISDIRATKTRERSDMNGPNTMLAKVASKS